MKYRMINGRKVSADGFSCGPGTTLKQRFCVAVKITSDSVMVRDTKDEKDITLRFNHDEWNVFLDGVRNGEFNI